MSDVSSFDGTRLALERWGRDDAPVVVLVHGLGLSTESWGRVPDLLAPDHRVIAYDLRGHAQSGDARSGDYSMEAHARDLEAVLREAVPQGRRPVLVGHSLGGGIILAHAHHVGADGVAGVVFAGSGGSGVTAPGFPSRGVPRWAQPALRGGYFRALRAVALLGRRIAPLDPLADRIVRRFASTPDTPRAYVDFVRRSFLTSRPLALSGTTLASLSHDGPRWAPELRVPVLVLHGSRDPEVPDDELRDLTGRLPDASVVPFVGAGHMLPLTHPDEVARHVACWVRHVHE